MGYTGSACMLTVAKAMVDWTLVDFRPTGDFAAASFTWPDGLLNEESTQKPDPI